jgi:adenylate kinase
MRIILLGPPGGGKGTQGALIETAWGFPRVSTGDLLRRAVRERTPLGLRAETRMNAGGLVEDDLVLGLVRERIARADCAAGYVLDGFPRTVPQAEGLEAMDADRSEIALDIAIDEKAMIQRLGRRLVCPECNAVFNPAVREPNRPGVCDACGAGLVRRPDDAPDVVSERLKVYRDGIEPLLTHYRDRNTLVRIDGSGSVDDVFSRIQAVLVPRLERNTTSRSAS